MTARFKQLLSQVEDIAQKAGGAILEIYNKDFAIYEKDDQSPLTEADLASHSIIQIGLEKLSDQYPILSEESAEVEWKERNTWSTYWLVDPLDGTKEFIKKNGEFTVNIALIHENRPALGVVYIPVTSTLYSGIVGESAWREAQGKRQAITTTPYESGTCIAMGSRSHQSEAVQTFLSQYDDFELKPAGSSLKFCLVAEGSAHIYPRFGPTSEWDTAAAHAVLRAAGGEVLNHETGQPLRYNTKESLLNPFFVAKG